MVTIRDVAQAAGVSASTVSRVLAGSDKISPATSKRVRHVAQQVGYRRNYLATAMKTGRTYSLGLITGAIENPFFAQLANDIEHAARQRGYSLTIVNGQEDADAQIAAAQTISQQHVDGVIIVPAGGISAGDIEPLGTTIPTVAVDRVIDSPLIPSLVADATEAVNNLLDDVAAAGYQKIALLTGPADTSTGRDRQQLLADGCRARQLDIVADKRCPYDVGQAYRMAPALFAGDKPDMVMCGSGTLAAGVMRYFSEHRIRVAVDIGIATFDDLYWFECTTPTITVIDAVVDLATRAVRRLVSMIDCEDTHHVTAADDAPSTAVYIPRASTQPLP